MSGFLDFLTGSIQSAVPEAMASAGSSEPADEPKADIASRLKADLQRDFGLNEVQAAAFVGNLAHESGGFKSLQEIKPMIPGSRGGFGYAQWTGPRRRQFEGWTAEKGLDPTSYNANYGFLKHELTNTPEGRVLNSLRQASDPATATQIVSNQFLRPGIPGMNSRQKWTQRVLGGDAIGTEGEPQPNRALAYAATRGRDPRANMPAPDANVAMGQMPMPARQAPPDATSQDNAGIRDLLLYEAGQSPQQQAPAQGGGGIMGGIAQAIGGLGGLGGIRIPGGGGGGGGTPGLPQPSLNPFAFGAAARENEQIMQKYRGQQALVQELVKRGIPAEEAVNLIGNEAALNMRLSAIGQQKSQAATQAAVQGLSGAQGGDAPAGGRVSVMNDPVLQGTTVTTRARMTQLLNVLGNESVAKGVREAAEKEYQTLLENSKMTSEQKTHAQALADGSFKGGIYDYEVGLKQAGRPQTTVSLDARAETAESKGRGEGLAKRWNDIADDGVKANEDAITFQRFADVLATVSTGKTTETLEKIRQFTGIALDPNTDNVQALNAMINYIAPRLRVPGSGAQSDRELGNFLQSIPSLAGTPGGNKIILDTMSGIVDYRKQRAAIAAEWQNGEISAKEAQKRADAIPLPFKKPEKPEGASGGEPAPSGGATTPKVGATATNPTTGEKRRFDGKEWVPFK